MHTCKPLLNIIFQRVSRYHGCHCRKTYCSVVDCGRCLLGPDATKYNRRNYKGKQYEMQWICFLFLSVLVPSQLDACSNWLRQLSIGHLLSVVMQFQSSFQMPAITAAAAAEAALTPATFVASCVWLRRLMMRLMLAVAEKTVRGLMRYFRRKWMEGRMDG